MKGTDFCTNRKPICDFLLVINSNLPPILHRFQVMADYWSEIFAIEMGVPHFNAPSRRWFNTLSIQHPANIQINFISPETRTIVLPDAENRTIVSSIVWTKHRNVTERRTDRISLASNSNNNNNIELVIHRPSSITQWKTAWSVTSPILFGFNHVQYSTSLNAAEYSFRQLPQLFIFTTINWSPTEPTQAQTHLTHYGILPTGSALPLIQ